MRHLSAKEIQLSDLLIMLAKLFGSQHRIKILRLFLLNPEKIFDSEMVARRSKVSPKDVRKELAMLLDIRFVRPRSKGADDAEKGSRDSRKGFQLNPAFPFIHALSLLLVNTVPFSRDEIVRRLRGIGKIKLIITSGIFIQRDDSRTDLLIVADEIKKTALDHSLRAMEAEIGRELNYGVFETTDFLYRLGVYDKFIRDVLDYPHEKIYDKIGLEEIL